jgi:hypothetical protein
MQQEDIDETIMAAFLELEPEFEATNRKLATIPLDEGMALLEQIKQSHDDLFRELADS